MKDISLIPNFAQYKTCTVISDINENEVIIVQNNEESPNYQDRQIYATIVNPLNSGRASYPKKGTIGLVIIKPDDPSRGYWIGKIRDTKKEQEDVDSPKPTPGSQNILTPEGYGIKNSNDSLLVSNKNGNLTLDKSGFSINTLNMILSITKQKFEVAMDGINFKVSKNEAKFSTTGLANIVGANGINLATNGNCVISGGIFNTEEKDNFAKLGYIDKFIVKSSEFRQSVSGDTIIDGGSYTINLSSGKIAGGQVPGKGSKQTFALKVAQGDATFAVGFGNINMSALGPANYLKFRAGQIPIDVAYSELKLTRLEATLINYPILSKFSMKGGTITLASIRDTKIDATMNVTISSKLKTSINAITNIELTANAMMKLQGTAKIQMTSAMLDLKSVNIIDTGPKVVTPTGTGPLCALTVCPILGIMHVGSQCVG